MAERQLIKQAFTQARASGAIQRVGELSGEANAEVVQSLVSANHLRRGFGDGLTEMQQAIFSELDRSLGLGVTNILHQAVQQLNQQITDDPLPSTDVTDFAVALRWLKNNLT